MIILKTEKHNWLQGMHLLKSIGGFVNSTIAIEVGGYLCPLRVHKAGLNAATCWPDTIGAQNRVSKHPILNFK